MNTKQYLLYGAALAALVAGVVLYLLLSPSGESVTELGADVEQTLKDAVVETPAVAPSANPLKQVVPTENPVEKTNPFKNDYQNPFE